MPFIVITVQDDGTGISITVNPRQGTADPNNRDYIWVLQSAGTDWIWDATLGGIVLAKDPPPPFPPYQPWPGDPAQPWASNSYHATAPENSGKDPVLYKYTINLVNSANFQTMRIDPDIANDPAG
jgi:hypothetical protein